jgi:hypothetical protein
LLLGWLLALAAEDDRKLGSLIIFLETVVLVLVWSELTEQKKDSPK